MQNTNNISIIYSLVLTWGENISVHLRDGNVFTVSVHLCEDELWMARQYELCPEGYPHAKIR